MKKFNNVIWGGLFWICTLSALLLLSGRFWIAWEWNKAGLSFMKGQKISIPLVSPNCLHIGLVGMIEAEQGNLSAQKQIYKQALGCSPRYISLIHSIMPNDLEMAQLATQYYPGNPNTWFWLAEVSNSEEPAAARQAYLRTLALAPRYGLAWCHLAMNYEKYNYIDLALEAYLNCCMNGDPGYNGCTNAGKIMEQKGNLQLAIDYYLRSYYSVTLEHARQLQKQLNP